MKLIATEYKVGAYFIKARHFNDCGEPYSWGLFDSFGNVYSKEEGGIWEYEIIPSSRDDEWLENHRFKSLGEVEKLIESFK